MLKTLMLPLLLCGCFGEKTDVKKAYQERLDRIEKIKHDNERVKLIERFETDVQGIFIYYEIDGMPCLKYGDGFTCDWDQWDHDKMGDYLDNNLDELKEVP